MIDSLTLDQFSFILAAFSTLLCLVISYQAYHSYKYMKSDYLLNFSAGFLLLAISYLILVPLAFGIKLPDMGTDVDSILNYSGRVVIHGAGLILIALAYSQTPRARKLLFGLIGALAILELLIILPQVYIPESVDSALYLMNTALVVYVMYHMLKVVPSLDLVFLGFSLFALDEYTAFIASLGEGHIVYLLAESLRLAGLLIFFLSFLLTRKGLTLAPILLRRVNRAEEI